MPNYRGWHVQGGVFSAFRRWVKAGEYDLDWCAQVEMPGEVCLEPDTW